VFLVGFTLSTLQSLANQPYVVASLIGGFVGITNRENGMIRRYFEAFMIRVAAKILIDRNVSRAAVVSRRDNNDMWYMAEQLEIISKRIQDKYENI